MATDWPAVPLGVLTKGGLRHGVYKPPQSFGSGTRVLKMGTFLSESRIGVQEMPRARLSSEEIARYGVTVGDLLFARTSTMPNGLGKCAMVVAHEEPFVFDGNILCATIDSDRADPGFVYYFFTSEQGQQAIQEITGGTQSRSVSATTLSKVEVPCPPLSDQASIALVLASVDDALLARQGETAGLRRLFNQIKRRLLSGEWTAKRGEEWLNEVRPIVQAYDDKIELNRRVNQTLEEICRALFKFWFVDFGPVRAKAEGRWKKGESLPGMPADMWDLWPSDFEESEIGEIPRGWKLRPLNEAADVSQGSTPSTENEDFWDPPVQDWVTVKDLSQSREQVLSRTERRVSRKGLEYLGSKVVPAGSILLSTGAPIGYVAVSAIPLALGTRVAAIQPHDPLGQAYTYQWVRASVDALRDAANGTTFPQLLLSTLREFPIPVPPARLLSLFETLLSPAEARVVANETESHILAETRDALLPKLLSGEIRVKVDT